MVMNFSQLEKHTLRLSAQNPAVYFMLLSIIGSDPAAVHKVIIVQPAPSGSNLVAALKVVIIKSSMDLTR